MVTSLTVDPSRWAPPTDTITLERARAVATGVLRTVDHVVAGASTCTGSTGTGSLSTGEIAVACLLSRGHLLIDDIPGVGKTLLAQVMAAAVGGTLPPHPGHARPPAR